MGFEKADPWNTKTNDTPQLTGIPPHILSLAKMEELKREIKSQSQRLLHLYVRSSTLGDLAQVPKFFLICSQSSQCNCVWHQPNSKWNVSCEGKAFRRNP